jgi:dTDP-4-dehydrorhamnose 3,5-epimerase
MRFIETKLKGAFIIELEPVKDERGFFARSFCQKEFKEHNLDFNVVQCNISYNKKAGTIRGMHHQLYPYEEIKLVQCIRGAIFDVIIDLHPESPTYKKWFGYLLVAGTYRMLYVPKGFAHGYLSLKNNTAVFYQVSEFYHPECEMTIRWNDPEFGIEWPKMTKYILSKKDQQKV